MSFIEQVRAAYPHAYCGYTDALDAPQGGRWAIYPTIQDACRSAGKVLARGKSGSAAWRNAAKAVAAHGATQHDQQVAELLRCHECGGKGERLIDVDPNPEVAAQMLPCPDCSGSGTRREWLEGIEAELRKVPGLNEQDIEVLTAMATAGLDYADELKRRRASGGRGGPQAMPRYWISWWQPGDDPRPLHFPPKETRVLGWWRSGYDGRRTSICAVVAASVEWTAKAAVAEDWPESINAEWRFVEQKAPDWTPGDRFPLSNWMVERFAASTEANHHA